MDISFDDQHMPSNHWGCRTRRQEINITPQTNAYVNPCTDTNYSRRNCPQNWKTEHRPSSNDEKRSPSKRGRRCRRIRKDIPPQKQRPSVDVEEQSRILSLDCEMVGVGKSGSRSALARVCLLNWDHDVLFDSYIRVSETVTDYRTYVSGIRAEDINSDQAIELEECRLAVQSIVKGKILVGHALKNDLRALRLYHSWQDIRDTAKYEPFMKTRFDDGVLWPRKLKDLVKEKLNRTIQPDGREHCPIEDSAAALDLYKSVGMKWEKVMDYKISRTSAIRKQKDSFVLSSVSPAQ